MHLDTLVARLLSFHQLHIAQWHLEKIRDETQQGFIGTAFYGRSGKTDFQGFSMQARN